MTTKYKCNACPGHRVETKKHSYCVLRYQRKALKSTDRQPRKYTCIDFNIDHDFMSRKPVSYPLTLSSSIVVNEKGTHRNDICTVDLGVRDAGGRRLTHRQGEA